MSPGPRGQSNLGSRLLLAAMVIVWPSLAWASFNGPIHLPFGICVVIGVLGALPGAVVVLFLEWKAATWTPPWWSGALAGLALVYCVGRLTGLVGPAGDRGWYLQPIPPLIQLVLITFVPSSRVRHVAGWSGAAAGSALLVVLVLTLNPAGPSVRSMEAWGLVGGGALTTALLWRLGVWLCQRTLHRLRLRHESPD
jgi:hypothetical protein